jgi:hypothetical protein
MRRLKISAFLLIAFCAVGCSKDPRGGNSDSLGDGDDDSQGPVRKDGGIKDAKVSTSTDGGKKDTGTGAVTPPDIIEDGSPFMQDDTRASGLSGGDIDKLKAGGDDCADGTILYPYDGTVFPVGLLPPAVMFAGANDGAYLKLTYKDVANIKYETAAAGADPGELAIPPEAWTQVLRRTKGQTLNAEISVMKGGKVNTCRYSWKVAQGALTGTVFYNTYNHPDLGGQGAIMRLPLGAAESQVYLRYDGPSVLAGPCISCHSVSFNGETMAASTHSYNPFSLSFETKSYAVSADSPPPVKSALPESTFGAFTPKGDKLLAMGNPQCTKGADSFPRAPNNFMLLQGPTVAALHDAATGEVLPAKGLNADWYMWMPQFSPDGRHVVFNHAKPDGNGGTDRRELAIMDYDNATNTFSNLKVVVTHQGPEPSIDYSPLPTVNFAIPGNTVGGNCDPPTPSAQAAIPQGTCDGPCYPGWPFFTPDGSAIIYVLGSEPDFAAAFPGRDKPSKSELWYVDIASGKQIKLSNAGDGIKADDARQNYYPTILPVSVGGYYWLFWTSTRSWGNRDTSPSAAQVGSNWFGGEAALNATRKRIWVSAIRPPRVQEGFMEDVTDFSSKPFYLEGQSNSGNIRAFAALNPCKQEGSECTSGIDCCTGYCNIAENAEKGSCVPEKTCSDLKEKCTEDKDCCSVTSGQPHVCISGFCDVQIL